MSHCRNANSHRKTYKKLLRHACDIMRDKVRVLEGDGDSAVSADHELTQHQATRTRPRRVRFSNSGVETSQFIFGGSRSYHPPKRARKKQIERGEVDENIVQRTSNCPGFPTEMLSNNKKQDVRLKCYICKGKTKWYCKGCHFAFCMTTKHTIHRTKEVYYEHEKENITSSREVTRFYGKSCYHKHHECGFKRALVLCAAACKDEEE